MKSTYFSLVFLFCSKFLLAQSFGSKTYDVEPVPFAKLPILHWQSDELIEEEPAWEGFLLVKAKLNGIYDINGGLQKQSTFNVGQIDVWGNDDRNRFSMDMVQSQVRLWSKRKTKHGDFVGYMEGDFWTDGGHFRLRHLWFDFKFLHVGQDWSFFGDKDIWPNVLDWDGPPSGLWHRATQIKFYFENDNQWKFEIGIQNPSHEIRFDESIDPSLNSTYPLAPDFIGAIKKSGNFGHLRISAIYRNLNYDYNGVIQSKPGYGTALSGYLQTNEATKNPAQFQMVVGKGISSYLSSFWGHNYDGVPTGNGDISTVPVLGSWISYEHWFGQRWHANIVLGFSDFKTAEIAMLTIDPPGYNATNTTLNLDHEYMLINVMYDPIPGLSVGIEYNLGNRDIQYTGTIDTGNGMIQSVQKARAAQRISFGAFFDF
ncbi:hypothetical protein [Reichenbachiella sp.]|uniref:hypothetical protein n=1 Tax=Reichenbachiella sp. TaxID=2184521 RepID=UPI003B5AE485